jgi:signal transduction histidine kinase
VGAGSGIRRISRASIDELERGRRTRLDVMSFDVSDQGREVGATRTRQPGAWKGRDGRLWFATQRGVVSVDPARVRVDTPVPPVLIEEAFVDGRRAARGAANAFPPGSGALEFHFAAITLLEPQKAQHRYRLEGFEDHWVEAGTRRVAYYTNVGPGRYRFLVQGSNADGIWNQTGDALAFSLAPHFHQTWFFYGGAGLALLALVLAFHRMRLAQVHGRYVATFAERTRVARELHDSLLQSMAAVLMQLRGLRKLFGGAVARPTDQAITGEITTIEEVVATNIEETRRLLWDLRGETRGGAADLGAAVARLARKLAGARGVEVRTSVEGIATPLPQHACRELLLITQEAITNALEHASASRIEVRLQYLPGEVALTISDDGQGFDPTAAPAAGHFGLQGMRERASALGSFAVESRPGGGTRIVVRVSRQELHDG